jgi:serine/threonine protein kinase
MDPSPARRRLLGKRALDVSPVLEPTRAEEAAILRGRSSIAEQDKAQVYAIAVEMITKTREMYNRFGGIGPLGYLVMLESFDTSLYSTYLSLFERPTISQEISPLLKSTVPVYGEAFKREALWIGRLWAVNIFVRSKDASPFNKWLEQDFLPSVPKAVYSRWRGEKKEVAIVTYFEALADGKTPMIAMELAHAAVGEGSSPPKVAPPPQVKKRSPPKQKKPAAAAPEKKKKKSPSPPLIHRTQPVPVAPPAAAAAAEEKQQEEESAAPLSARATAVPFSPVPSTLSSFTFGGPRVREMYFSPRSITEDKYLGKGGNGKIYTVSIKGDPIPSRRYVQKGFLDEDHSTLQDSYRLLWTEVRFMVECAGPRVVAFIGWTMKKDKFLIVMEWMQGGDMSSWIYSDGGNQTKFDSFVSFTAQQRDSLIYDMIRGLDSLHSKFVVHRDLKPWNIFMSKDGHVAKIGDLGNCFQLKSSNDIVRTEPGCGTPQWNPPEQGYGAKIYYNTRKVIPGAANYGLPADVYALGVMIMEIFAETNWASRKSQVDNDRMCAVLDPVFLDMAKQNMEQPAWREASECISNTPSSRPTISKLLSLGPSLWSAPTLSAVKKVSPEFLPDLVRQEKKRDEEEMKVKIEEHRRKKEQASKSIWENLAKAPIGII